MVTRIKAVDGPFITNTKKETFVPDVDERIQNTTISVVIWANQPWAPFSELRADMFFP